MTAARDNALEVLTNWTPNDTLEAGLRDEVVEFLLTYEDGNERHSAGFGHITASAVIVDPLAEKILLTHHPKFDRWMQLGGHFEPEDQTAADAALREGTEESGLTDLQIDRRILGLDIHPVTQCPPGRPSRHMDLRFLITADSLTAFTISDESLDLAWWPLNALPEGAADDLVRLIPQIRKRLQQNAA